MEVLINENRNYSIKVLYYSRNWDQIKHAGNNAENEKLYITVYKKNCKHQ